MNENRKETVNKRKMKNKIKRKEVKIRQKKIEPKKVEKQRKEVPPISCLVFASRASEANRKQTDVLY
jgi:hypothetical protein